MTRFDIVQSFVLFQYFAERQYTYKMRILEGIIFPLFLTSWDEVSVNDV